MLYDDKESLNRKSMRSFFTVETIHLIKGITESSTQTHPRPVGT